MATAKLNDIEIYYEIRGKGSPLVLIAGFTCDHTFWNNMMAQLAQHFQVLVFDNRAVGRSKDSGKPFSIATMANDIIALMEYLKLTKPIIIGQSMGGLIAQTIAAQFPDKISKLIILNSVEKINVITLMALANIINLRKANVSLDLVIEMTLPWMFSAEYLAMPEHIHTFKELAKSNPAPQSIADQARQFTALKNFDSRLWSKNIIHPALVIAAKADIVTLTSESQQLAHNMGAEFITIPGGHSSPIEQPEKLNQYILDFLLST